MNTNFYNVRDNYSRFTSENKSVKVNFRNKNRIVSGRLYKWKNILVRAHGTFNGKRIVSFHKTLTGFVNDNELSNADSFMVQEYLENS